jgi:membrane peptidoglycan carboxypeptidase
VRVALGLLILAAATLAVNAVTGPDVQTAPALVAAVDLSHHSPPLTIAREDRIAVALVAVEDDSFYSDYGVNVAALLRSLWGYLRGTDAGGSTIEIQLAHMLYPADTVGLWGRVHLVTTALEFDAHYTKLAILSMYLDAAYFGHGFFGIDAASNGYFGVQPTQLNWTQAAMLAGLVQAPSTLDPFAHLTAARERMTYVLQRLVATGQMTQAQAKDASQGPLHLRGPS